MRGFLIAACVASVSLPGAALAQSSRLNVSVSQYGDDPIGKTITFRLKDKIQASGSFSLVPADTTSLMFVIRSIAIEGAGQSAYSATVVFHFPTDDPDWYIDSTVGYCGGDVANTCADKLLERFGPTLLEYRDALDAEAKKAPKSDAEPKPRKAPAPTGRPISLTH